MFFLKELYYRLRLREPLLNNDVDPLPNYVAQYLLEHPWQQVHEFDYDCYVYLDDDITVEFWNGNKYYSWFSSGKMYIHNDLENALAWEYVRPNTEFLYKLKKKLDHERAIQSKYAFIP